MKQAQQLARLIGLVRGKLQAEEIDPADYDKSIKCLEQCVAPKLCIVIYEQYINY